MERKTTSVTFAQHESRFNLHDDEEMRIDENLPTAYFQRFFQELDDDVFLQTVEMIDEEFRQLQLENEMFIMHLMTNEPILLRNLAQAKLKIKTLNEKTPIFPHLFKEIPEEIFTADTIQFSEGLKINIAQRNEMIGRHYDEHKADSTDFHRKTDKLRIRLKAEIEESAIRLEETENQMDDFAKNIAAGASDSMTERVPLEKFILHLNTGINTARRTTEKIRLNIAYNKGLYAKLKATFTQKQDLGESITNMAFEELHIANETLSKRGKIQNKNIEELKLMHGSGSMALTRAKINLFKYDKQYNELEGKIRKCEDHILDILRESKRTTEIVRKVKSNYLNVKRIVDNYKAPDAIEYLQVKQREQELLEENKVLRRKENILNLTLKGLEANLMNLLHKKTINPAWYLPRNGDDFNVDDLEPDDEFLEEDIENGVDPDLDIFDVRNGK